MMKWTGFALLTLLASSGCVYEYYGYDEEVCRPRCGDDSTCMQACSAEQDTDAGSAGIDTDGDGLADADEAACNTNPGVADTDGDGVLDGDEDPDGDGASNAEEIAAGTDPANGNDTPADDPPPPPPPPPDTDGDGLIDEVEGSCNTNPGLADTDGDGVLDGDEDPDGDGFSNAEEIAAGTNPANGADYPGAPDPQDPPVCDAGPSCGDDAGQVEPEDPPVEPEDPPVDPDCPACTACTNCDEPTPEDPVCPFADAGESCRPEPYCGECEWICQHDGDWAYCMQTCSSCVVTCVEDECGNDSCSFEGNCGYETSCRECMGPSCPWNDHNVDIDCASLGQHGSSPSALALLLGLLALPLRRLRRR